MGRHAHVHGGAKGNCGTRGAGVILLMIAAVWLVLR